MNRPSARAPENMFNTRMSSPVSEPEAFALPVQPYEPELRIRISMELAETVTRASTLDAQPLKRRITFAPGCGGLTRLGCHIAGGF
jgi:hypothetical protein